MPKKPAADKNPAAREGVPLMARIPEALNAKLRRVMLERRLADTPPYELKDVLADALELWLTRHAK